METATASDAVTAAWTRLRADPSFQFGFSPSPKAPAPPMWLVRALRPVFRALGWLLRTGSPYIRIGVWVVLGLAVLGLAALIWRQSQAKARAARAAPLALHALGEAANQAAARAAARLADADRLAAEGRFGEAIHMLLLTGVDDVERGRPGRIRPSFTSRDIAALPDLPPEPRAAFARIATVVERALFGGREVDARAWDDCRDAYGALVRPEAWTTPAAVGAAA